jgi:hypothetical protein
VQVIVKWADLLLDHMRTCRICIGAKVSNTPNYCPYGKELIRATLKERHGDIDE